jgi:hypothetical protein
MGDFNYRINANMGGRELANLFLENQNDADLLHNIYLRYDELRDQMIRQNIYGFEEGVGDKGPTFIPTAKMIKRTYDEIIDFGEVVEELEDEDDFEMIEGGELIFGSKDDRIAEQEIEQAGWLGSFANAASLVGGALGTTAYAVGGAMGNTLGYMTNTSAVAKSALPKSQLLRPHNGQVDNVVPTGKKVKLYNPPEPSVPSHELAINERGNTMWNTGKWDQRLPSWTDRILYGTTLEGKGEIICTHYNRFDRGDTMLLSDHAGVIGTYLITNQPADFISFRREIAPINPTEMKEVTSSSFASSSGKAGSSRQRDVGKTISKPSSKSASKKKE